MQDKLIILSHHSTEDLNEKANNSSARMRRRVWATEQTHQGRPKLP